MTRRKLILTALLIAATCGAVTVGALVRTYVRAGARRLTDKSGGPAVRME